MGAARFAVGVFCLHVFVRGIRFRRASGLSPSKYSIQFMNTSAADDCVMLICGVIFIGAMKIVCSHNAVIHGFMYS